MTIGFNTLPTGSNTFSPNFRSITGSTTSDTASMSDCTIAWNSAQAVKSQVLPAANAVNKNQIYNICDENKTATVSFPINITALSSTTVNGVSSLPITTAAGTWSLQSDGNGNYVIV